MSKVCIIYHSIDLDGWMSAAIVKHWFITSNVPKMINNSLKGTYGTTKLEFENNTIDFIGYNYGEPIPPDLSKYDKVIMCDISFPATIMSALNLDNTKEIIWLDHHLSAINESINPTDDGIRYDRNGSKVTVPYNNVKGLRDTKYAACELTWKYFFPNKPMPEIVRLLGRYDCFGHKGTDEERKVLELQYGARANMTNYEDCYSYLVNELDGFKNPVKSWAFLAGIGEHIYKYLCTEAKQAYKNGFEINIGQSPTKLVDIATIPNTEPETLKNAPGTFLPYKFICINKERFNPVNFGIDYHKDGYDGCACFHYANGIWNFSLYNDNGQVDCSQIAKQFGGGGHAGASGFRLNNEEFIKLINGR